MSRILLGVFFTAVLSFFVFGSVDSNAGLEMGEDGVAAGVSCEINEVKLFAQSAEDCEKAGGTAGDAVPADATEMSDNPGEEPEIQRTKDKEPVAP